MFGSFLGKVLSAPVKLVNAPLHMVDKAVNYALDDRSDSRVLSAPLKAVSDVIEETAEDICDD
jgi:hypothetical protein